IFVPENSYSSIRSLLSYVAEQVAPEYRTRLQPEPTRQDSTSTNIGVTTNGSAVPSSPADIPPIEVPVPLAMACASRECVLFAGSGLCARAHLPTWPKFVEGLLDWSVRHQLIDTIDAQVQRQALAEGELNAVADNLADLYERHRQKALLLD